MQVGRDGLLPLCDSLCRSGVNISLDSVAVVKSYSVTLDVQKIDVGLSHLPNNIFVLLVC